jgi:hypothetical protein
MLLRVANDVTDKDGHRLGIRNGIYTHHIGLINTARRADMAPLDVAASICPDAKDPLLIGFSNAPTKQQMEGKLTEGHSHMKRQAFPAGFRPPFSPLLVKGNEADAVIYAPVNCTAVKSGYWIGSKDTILSIAEIIKYNAAQDVYVTVNYDYVSFENSNGVRPADYLTLQWEVLEWSNADTTTCISFCKFCTESEFQLIWRPT